MPIYKVGDLVRYRALDEPEDYDSIGLILEMRAMPYRQADACVLWSDMSEPRWHFITSLAPMEPVQPEQPVVE